MSLDTFLPQLQKPVHREAGLAPLAHRSVLRDDQDAKPLQHGLPPPLAWAYFWYASNHQPLGCTMDIFTTPCKRKTASSPFTGDDFDVILAKLTSQEPGLSLAPDG